MAKRCLKLTLGIIGLFFKIINQCDEKQMSQD